MKKKPTLVIEAGRAERHYWRDLWRYRELFYFLAWRDMLARYKQTVIGACFGRLHGCPLARRLLVARPIGIFTRAGNPTRFHDVRHKQRRLDPVDAYGKSKFACEQAMDAARGVYLFLRATWVGSAGGSNFVLIILRLAGEKKELSVVVVQIGSPTWARALAQATVELLGQNELIAQHSGVYHLTASGHTTRYEFTRAIIDIMKEVSGIPNGWARVKPIGSDAYPLPARRPHRPVTGVEKIKRVFGIEMAAWRRQLQDCLGDPGTHGAFQSLVRGR